MINKNSLWFVTLTSIILVLGIYYVSMPTNNLKGLDESSDTTQSVMESSTALVALRIEDDEVTIKRMEELQNILLDVNALVDEKNIAYEELLQINATKGLEEKIQKKVLNELNVEAFIKIEANQISVVTSNNENDSIIANNIIRCIQEEFDTQKFITVKFQ